MASQAFNVLQLFHVVGAMILVGYLAAVAMWRMSLRKDAEPGVVRHFLGTLRRSQTMLVLPAIGLVILTGLLMTAGPLAEGYLLAVDRMSQAGLVLALIIGFMVASGLGGPARKMLSLVEKGEGVGPAMDKLWSDWWTSLAAAGLLALVATALMVFGAMN